MTTASPRYRIGIDARFFRKETAGLGRYSRELLYGLANLDHTNEYYIFLTEADMAEWNIDLPNFHPVVTPVGHYTPQEQTAFLRLLYSYKLDLMHFLNFNHPLLYRRPFVTTLHDLTLFHFKTAGPVAKRLVKEQAFQLVFRHSLRAARKVIAISEYTAHDAERTLKIPHPKMEVVYEGGPQPVQLLPGAKDAVRRFIGTTDPYFVFVSQWRPHKGILTLLDAFELFKKQTGFPHKLVLSGKPVVVSEEIRDRMVNSPFASDIVAPGFAPEEVLPALYYYATALIVPSEYEGFGLPVLEGFSYGTAVISSDSTSLPEVGGDGALYFPVRNSEKLAEQMLAIASDAKLRADLINRGVKQLRKFSWQKCAEQTIDVYYSILEKQR